MNVLSTKRIYIYDLDIGEIEAFSLCITDSAISPDISNSIGVPFVYS